MEDTFLRYRRTTENSLRKLEVFLFFWKHLEGLRKILKEVGVPWNPSSSKYIKLPLFATGINLKTTYRRWTLELAIASFPYFRGFQGVIGHEFVSANCPLITERLALNTRCSQIGWIKTTLWSLSSGPSPKFLSSVPNMHVSLKMLCWKKLHASHTHTGK